MIRSVSGGDPGLDKAYEEAVIIMKEKAVSFYHAFSNLPEERFKGVAAVYAFCRTADDISDNEYMNADQDSRAEKLDDLEQAVKDPDNNSSGHVLRESWWPAFKDSVNKFRIPDDAFFDQIRGQRMDLDFEGIKTLDELIDYCSAVAGSVGRMLLPVLADDARDVPEDMRDACGRLGIGMQITNILRDVGEDLAKRDRVYLPEDLMKKHGIVPGDLSAILASSKKNPVIPGVFIELWEELSSIADTYYESYLKWLGRFQPECRLPLVAAALNYHAIADAVRENGYDCFCRRNYTSASKREEMLVKASEIVRSFNAGQFPPTRT